MSATATSTGTRKVIVTCAVTGAVHVPSQSPYLPITPEEIAEKAIGAAEAGAAILHLHARDPENGRPTPDPDVFMDFLPEIKERTNAVINITTGGGQGMTLEQRLAAADARETGDVLAQHGLDEFRPFPIANRIKEFKFDWEAADLERPATTSSAIPTPTSSTSSRARRTHGVRFEFECYDVGHLYNLAHFLDRGLVKPPLLRADHLRHSRRHRHRPRRSAPHEADRRSAVWRRLHLVDPRRRSPPVEPGHHGRDHGRQRPRRA